MNPTLLVATSLLGIAAAQQTGSPAQRFAELQGHLVREVQAQLRSDDLKTIGGAHAAAANGFSDNLTLFFQGAPGVFTPGASALPTGGLPESVAAADLDADGDLDLVSANSFSANLTLFFGGR